MALKHAVGLGQTPNAVPLAKPKFKENPRAVEVGWHPVGGVAGKWFAEDTGLGKMITEKINKYPDPTQHWAVLVGDFAHQLWMVSAYEDVTPAKAKCGTRFKTADRKSLLAISKDENFHVIYTNERINREGWRTFPVGETRFNDDAIRRAGEHSI